MSVKYIKGDLLKFFKEGRINVLVHGCNCYCKMGAGIAKQIKEQFPQAYQADLRYEDKQTLLGNIKEKRDKLGKYSSWKYKENQYIVNAYTQDTYWDPEKMLSYPAIRKVFTKINKDFSNLKIGIPFIGCGLAKGNWSRVSEILEEIFEHKPIFVFYINDSDFNKNVLAQTGEK